MSNDLSPFEALKLAVQRAGGQAPTARICGVSQPAVWKWLQSGKRLPAEYALALEAATGVSKHLLRPDIYPFSVAAEGNDPGEECGGIIAPLAAAVACDRIVKLQRKDIH